MHAVFTSHSKGKDKWQLLPNAAVSSEAHVSATCTCHSAAPAKAIKHTKQAYGASDHTERQTHLTLMGQIDRFMGVIARS